MAHKKEDGASRRDFLQLAGTAAPAAVAAATLTTKDAELPVAETRIQDTAHTRAYLDSARFSAIRPMPPRPADGCVTPRPPVPSVPRQIRPA